MNTIKRLAWALLAYLCLTGSIMVVVNVLMWASLICMLTTSAPPINAKPINDRYLEYEESAMKLSPGNHGHRYVQIDTDLGTTLVHSIVFLPSKKQSPIRRMMFLHGIGGSALSFSQAAEKIAEKGGYEVHCLDV
jgi:hypothetical protein